MDCYPYATVVNTAYYVDVNIRYTVLRLEVHPSIYYMVLRSEVHPQYSLRVLHWEALVLLRTVHSAFTIGSVRGFT